MIKYIVFVSLVLILLTGCSVDQETGTDPRDQTIKDLRSRVTILEDQIAKKVHCDAAKECPAAPVCNKCEVCPKIDCEVSETNLIYKAKVSYDRAKSEQRKAKDSMEDFMDEYDDENHADCPGTNDETIEYLFDANMYYGIAKAEFEKIDNSELAEAYVNSAKYIVLANEELSNWLYSYRESCRRGDFDYMDEDDKDYEDYEKYMRSYDRSMLKIEIIEDADI